MCNFRKSPWLIALLVTLHGCASDPMLNDGGGTGGGPVGAGGPGADGTGGGVQVTPAGPGSGLGEQDYGSSGSLSGQSLGSPDDPNSPLYERIIYFDYNSNNVAPEYQIVISNHALYLNGNPNAIVSLEGHTDERGTREYNLALGEERAQSVSDLLLLQGAASNQTQTLTYGEERPSAIGSTEADWRNNRRVEIVYLSQ